jgi:hypothetical protein
MRKYQLEFCRILVGSIFAQNGNKYQKISKRTALLEGLIESFILVRMN